MLQIGVTSGFLYPDATRPGWPRKTMQTLEGDMARYLVRHDALPVLIPNVERAHVDAILERMDGLVLQGGNDTSPRRYDRPYLDAEKWPGDEYRDAYEYPIIARAVELGIPVLGICLGMQKLNVHFGGTLHQDLPTILGNDVRHRDAESYDRNHHEVELVTGGLISRLYQGARRLVVNSVHHQGVERLGQNLAVEAVSPLDGLIEAIRYNGPRDIFVLGVQWHPEFSPTLAGTVADPAPIYDQFLSEARRFRETRA